MPWDNMFSSVLRCFSFTRRRWRISPMEEMDWGRAYDQKTTTLLRRPDFKVISLQYDIELLRLPPWRVGNKLTCLVLLHRNPTVLGLPNITKTQTFKHQNVWLFVNKNSSAISGEKIEKSGRGARLVVFFSPQGDTTQRRFRRCFCGIKTRQDKYTNCSFFFNVAVPTSVLLQVYKMDSMVDTERQLQTGPVSGCQRSPSIGQGVCSETRQGHFFLLFCTHSFNNHSV